MARKKTDIIKLIIPREELQFTPRLKLKATKEHRDKTSYTRKKKHKKRIK